MAERCELHEELTDQVLSLAAGNILPVPIEPQWLPIDSAPKDGTPFLAYASSGVWMAWRFDLDNAYGSWHCWYGANPQWCDDGAVELNPTHWMPLPAPPREI